MMRRLNLLFAGFVVLSGCSSSSNSSNSPASSNDGGAVSETSTGNHDGHAPEDDASVDDALNGCTVDPGAPAVQVNASSTDDPIGGADKFTIANALAGFPPASGKLIALLRTHDGVIRCELDEANAPISVANFVGLSRGTRPYRVDSSGWKVGHFYDGLTWHRVIPGFVIQGGDPRGNGTGGPGYDLVEENHAEEPLGTLAMAAGNEPSGSQFYIVVGTGPQPNYNVFGKCDTETAIAIAKVARDKNDKPTTRVTIDQVEIARCP